MRLTHLCAPLAHRGHELHAFLEQAFTLFARTNHFPQRLEDIARTEIKTAVKALYRLINIFTSQARIFDATFLVTRFIEQRIYREIAIGGDVLE